MTLPKVHLLVSEQHDCEIQLWFLDVVRVNVCLRSSRAMWKFKP
jgi:hypothetical protein